MCFVCGFCGLCVFVLVCQYEFSNFVLFGVVSYCFVLFRVDSCCFVSFRVVYCMHVAMAKTSGTEDLRFRNF